MEQLQRQQNDEQELERQNQFLTFKVDGECYGIGILEVKEILEHGRITPVPMMPEFIRGVINVRGRVVPVVDLSVRFGGRPAAVTKRTCIIIVEMEGESGTTVMGLMVGAVETVLEIPQAEVEPPPALGTRIRTDFIRGMGRDHDGFIILLALDKVLSVEELSQVESLGRSRMEGHDDISVLQTAGDAS